MTSHHMLSDEEYLAITSQKEKLPKKFNRSQYMSRVESKVEQAFNTFDLIIQSKNVPDKYVNELFTFERLERLFSSLTDFNWHEGIISDQNGLKISQSMLDNGIKYFLRRFNKTRILHKQITDMKYLLQDLQTIAIEEKNEEEKSQIYKYRKFLGLPPKIMPESHYTALCMICWIYGSGNDEKEAIKKIRHVKGCNYDKNDPDRCFKVYKPRGKQIPLKQ